MARFLMLVSARVDATLRHEVGSGRLPCPEYLRMAQRHGVQLLDWSSLDRKASGRSTWLALSHARAALNCLGEVDAVFSDGEHVGVPLALGMRVMGLRTPHLMLGHHLTTGAKRAAFRLLRPQARVSRVLVHSRRQLEMVARELRVPRQQLAFVPYGVDDVFWSPRPAVEEPLVLSVGREHRDYVTLARACRQLPARVLVAAGSTFSPGARQDEPHAWPPNFTVGRADPMTLRDWYARASLVVVPLVPNDFQAGVTVILEAMAMGKAVVVTATAGQRDVVVNGVTGLMVPPADADTLGEVVARLLAAPAERRRLGINAREAVRRFFGLDIYADTLTRHLEEISSSQPPALPPNCPDSYRDDQPMSSMGHHPYHGRDLPAPQPRLYNERWRDT